MPMWFLSGALFPMDGAAPPLEILMRANPVTAAWPRSGNRSMRSAAAGPVAPAYAWTVTVSFAAAAFGLAVAVARR